MFVFATFINKLLFKYSLFFILLLSKILSSERLIHATAIITCSQFILP